MKYKSVCTRLKLSLLPVMLTASLVVSPAAVAFASDEGGETTESVQEPAPAKSEPKNDPAPASEGSSGGDTSGSGGGQESSGQESGGQESGGQESSGQESSGQDNNGQDSSQGEQGGQEGQGGDQGEGTETSGQNDGTENGENPGPSSPEEGGDPADPGEGNDPAGENGEDPSVEEPGEQEAPAEEPEILQPGRNNELPEGAELADAYTGTNEALIASQHIVNILPQKEDFRFFDAEGTPALVKKEAYIYEKKETSSEKVGQAGRLAGVSILEKDGKWAYVETKDVRGFIQLKNLAADDEKEALLRDREERMDSLKDKIALLDQRMQNSLSFSAGSNPLSLVSLTAQRDAAAVALEQMEAEEKNTVTALVPWYENEAYLYMRGTSLKHIAEKKYALAADKLSVREKKSLTARSVGTAEKGALLYILQESGSWYYVESGDVRGYVRASDLQTGKKVKEKVLKEKEDSFPTALQLISPDKNHALYDTILSVKEGTKENPIRRQILELAEKSLGCPYVWGGTDLYHGADCSGFVQSLYRAFGYSIPRVAEAQSRYGTQIPVEDAQPGDLIFFARNGYVYHVAMYWGDGVTIEAYSSGRGITQVANVYSRDAVWATRILD